MNARRGRVPARRDPFPPVGRGGGRPGTRSFEENALCAFAESVNRVPFNNETLIHASGVA